MYLCLDLSLSKTGWSIMENSEVFKYGYIKIDHNTSDAEKMMHVRDVLSFLLSIHDIEYVIIEDIFYMKNVKTYRRLCAISGVIECLSYEHVGNKIFMFPATHARSCFSLKGKQEVFDFIKNKYNFEDFIFDEHNDICDSILLGLCFEEKKSIVKTKDMLKKEKVLGVLIEDLLFKYHWSEDMNLNSISKKLKIPYNTLKAWFNKLKIPVKDRKYKNSLFNSLEFEQEQVLLGTLLGDGCLQKSCGNSGNTRLQMLHCIKQKEYLLHKSSFFPEADGEIIDYYSLDKRLNKYYRKVVYFTKYFCVFNKYRDLLYKNEIKVVTKELLDKLDVLAVAIWYMDDGTFRKTGKNSGQLRICTHSFTRSEHELMKDWFFNKYSIEFKIGTSKDKNYLIISNIKNINKFFSLIEEYIIDEMSYKILTKENKIGTTKEKSKSKRNKN